MHLPAELLPHDGLFKEYSELHSAAPAAVQVFLILICLGVAAGIGILLHSIKRPFQWTEAKNRLAERALPSGLLLVIFSATVFFCLLASLCYTQLFAPEEPGPKMVVLQSLLFHLPALLLAVFLVRRFNPGGLRRLGLRRTGAFRFLGLSVLFYLAALPPVWFGSALYQFLLRQSGHPFAFQDVVLILSAPASVPLRILLFFTAIVAAPVFEEIIFRGLLFPALLRKTGLWPAVALVSLLFGGLHMHLYSLGPLFLLSVAFCFAYLRSGSLIVPIGMHAVFNGVTVILLMTG